VTRRLSIFSGVLGAALSILIIAVAISTKSGEDSARPKHPSARDVTRILHGIPQKGLVLGDPRAPVLLVEFADLQCPYCREFAATSWPDIVQKYVRTGKVRMELRLTDILGKDSAKANRAVMAASLQNRMWDASMRFYDVQGEENSGYVTPIFLRGILSGVTGLNLAQALEDETSPAVREQLAAVHSLQSRYAVTSTPTILIGTDTNDLSLLSSGVPSSDKLAQAINEQLLKTI
jgi:protein-disulfide isomerase